MPRATDRLLGITRNVIAAAVFVRTVAQATAAASSIRTVSATKDLTVSLRGLEQIAPFVPARWTWLGSVKLLTQTIFTQKLSARTEEFVIAKLVLVLVFPDTRVSLVNALHVLTTVTNAERAFLSSFLPPRPTACITLLGIR